MFAIGFYGPSNVGKTSFIEKVLAELGDKYSVAVVKNAPHHQDLDSDGKDSHRYVEAGAETALVCGDGRSLVSISHRMEIDETKRLINLLGNHDLIIFESFRDAGIPKIRLGDGDVEDGTVLDNPSPEEAISFIEGKMRDAIQPMVYLDGKKIPLGEYPGLALETTIRALVSTLKGAENGMEGRLEIILGKKG